MDFAAALRAAPIGATIAVADGEPEPPRDLVRQWGKWRRRNFTGTLVEKEIDRMVVRVESDGNSLPFTVTEEMGCVFSFPAPDLEVAEKIALEKIEQGAEEASFADVSRSGRQVALVALWNEVQQMKQVDFAALTTEEKALQFPTVAAIASLSGNTMPQVATAIQTRLKDRRRRLALWEAKLILGEDAIRAAGTVEDKLAAADAVVWSE